MQAAVFISGIHAVRLHIPVDLLPVLLLLGLDVIERLPQLRLSELEHAGVVEGGSVLFGGQQVGTQVAILLLFGGFSLGVVGGEGGNGGLLGAARGGGHSVLDLTQGIEMLLLHPRKLLKELLELGIMGALGMLGVLVDAKLLLPLEVLDEGGFLLCEYHNFLRGMDFPCG